MLLAALSYSATQTELNLICKVSNNVWAAIFDTPLPMVLINSSRFSHGDRMRYCSVQKKIQNKNISDLAILLRNFSHREY